MRKFFVLCLIVASFPVAAEDPSLRAAFQFAFPIYEMARTRANALGNGAAPGLQTANTLAHRAALADHRSRTVTSPNNDTLYSSSWLDLAGGPVLLEMPALPDRYHSAALMDIFTDNFAILGTRTNGGKGGRFLIAGPAWEGKVPDGATLVRARTNDVWLLIRVLVDGPDDLAAARAAQADFKLNVMDSRGRPFRSATPNPPDAESFVDAVNEMLARGPIPKAHAVRLQKFAAFGLQPGARFRDLSTEQQTAWRNALSSLLAELRTGDIATGTVRTGWTYPRPGIGDFGDDDAYRARVALGGLAALPPEEAMYLGAREDVKGRPFEGNRRYRLHIPSGGVPVHERGFWSLTMYEVMPDGRRFLVANPIGRYSIGNRTPGLKRNDDGSVDISLQHHAPVNTANWLPAPSGQFALTLRAYLPKTELLEQRWTLPAVESVD